MDTDILIDYLRGDPRAVDFIEDKVDHLHLSTISVAELFQGVRDGDERSVLESMLGALTVLPVTEEIAREAGLFRRRYHKSHGCGLADCLIAATALEHGLQLHSLNTRHFPMLADAASPYAKD